MSPGRTSARRVKRKTDAVRLRFKVGHHFGLLELSLPPKRFRAGKRPDDSRRLDADRDHP